MNLTSQYPWTGVEILKPVTHPLPGTSRNIPFAAEGEAKAEWDIVNISPFLKKRVQVSYKASAYSWSYGSQDGICRLPSVKCLTGYFRVTGAQQMTMFGTSESQDELL